MKLRPRLWVISIGSMLSAAPSAEAHTFGAQGSGLLEGIAHPAGGLDHILAMVAVGLWAGQIGGRAIWCLPMTFVSTMAVAGVVGMAGTALPLVETGILFSLVALGLAIALRPKFPLVVPTVAVALFAVFHGYAHGAELPQAASPALYALGFVTATLALHALGIGLVKVLAVGKEGTLFPKVTCPAVGSAIALYGLYSFLL